MKMTVTSSANLVRLFALCQIFWLSYSGADHSQGRDYRAFKVFRIRVKNEEALQALVQLEHQPDHFNIWNYPKLNDKPMLISTSPTGLPQLLSLVNAFNLTHDLMSGDLGRDIGRQKYLTRVRRNFRPNRRRSGRSVHQDYRSYEELMEAIDQYPRDFPFVKVETVAETEEGRLVKGMLISKNKSNPVIWIDAGIHAREWIAPASAMYLIDRLLTKSGQKLLEKFQFYVIPLLNPDGYAYSHTTDRLWRKNRAQVPGEYCVGTDLNRNFPLKWGIGAGTSAHICEETHRGVQAASEAETKGMIKKLKSFGSKLKLYLSLHSYGQYLLTPYGFAKFHYTKNHKDQVRMGHLMSKAIRERHGYVYQVGSASDLLYEASGASDDYAAGVIEVPYTFTMELLDEGRYAFLLPPSYIHLVGRQVWTAVKVVAHNL